MGYCMVNPAHGGAFLVYDPFVYRVESKQDVNHGDLV